jgi:hypothetical protein
VRLVGRDRHRDSLPLKFIKHFPYPDVGLAVYRPATTVFALGRLQAFGDRFCVTAGFQQSTLYKLFDTDGIGDECECTAANLDGVNPVDFEDFSILVLYWLESGPDGDTNRDAKVDLDDLAQVVQWWLESCD